MYEVFRLEVYLSLNTGIPLRLHGNGVEIYNRMLANKQNNIALYLFEKIWFTVCLLLEQRVKSLGVFPMIAHSRRLHLKEDMKG